MDGPLDADLSELHGVKLKLPNLPQTAREADLSELHGVKLPEVPQIGREADMDMDIIQKLLDADQDIDDGKILLFFEQMSNPFPLDSRNTKH